MTRIARGATGVIVALSVALSLGCDLGRGLEGTPLNPPRALPAFTLTRADGATYRTTPEHDRPMLVLFGYTNCPDVCPTTLADWVRVKQRLGADAARVRFLFVSVDPARDTPAIAQAYAAKFDPSFVGVTADSATLTRMQQAFGVASFEEGSMPMADSSMGHAMYLVNHTTATFLVDARGRLVAVHSFGRGWNAIASNLERLL